MIRFFPFLMALIGLTLLSFPVHEGVHWFGVEEPQQFCLGVDTNNSNNPLDWYGGSVTYNGELYWYGSEFVAYTAQFLFITFGLWLILRSGGEIRPNKEQHSRDDKPRQPSA